MGEDGKVVRDEVGRGEGEGVGRGCGGGGGVGEGRGGSGSGVREGCGERAGRGGSEEAREVAGRVWE